MYSLSDWPVAIHFYRWVCLLEAIEQTTIFDLDGTFLGVSTPKAMR
jgi:hypothetical protein